MQRIERELAEAQTLVLEYMRKVLNGELTLHQAKQAQNLIQASHALNRATSIRLEYNREVELTGLPPEQANSVIKAELAEAERLLEQVPEVR